MREPAAIYARVSTAGQDSKDQWASLPAQVAALRDLAARHGFDIGFEYQEVMSGAKAQRPKYQEMLDRARRGEVKSILVVHFDRLTRSEKIGEWETVKEELRRLGVRLITLKAGEIDLSGTPDAETRSDMEAVWAKRERLTIRQRTMEGRARKGKAGAYTGHHPPYGYRARFTPEGDKVFPIQEDEAAIVRQVFEWFAKGQTVSAITRRLTEGDYPLPEGRRKNRSGFWHPQTVREMLSQPSYAGLSSWHRGKEEAAASSCFPAIIAPDLWEEVQLNLEATAMRAPRGPVAPRPLSGLLRCVTCGSKMHSHVGSRNPRCRSGRNPDMYSCSHDVSRPPPCPSRQFIRQDVSEEAVLAYLAERLPRYLEGDALHAHAAQRTATPAGPSPERLERDLDKLMAKRSKLMDWILDNPEHADAGSARLTELKAQIAKAEADLVTARKAAEVKPATSVKGAKAFRRVAELIGRGAIAPEHRRELFQATILQVVVVKTSNHGARPQKAAVERLQLLNGAWI